jgi:aspartyl-tRNA(Asn)/glutamyl-tRNA(Gln) amidotransferase subunit A
MATSLAENSTTVKNALEAYMAANPNRVYMDLTDNNGKTIKRNLSVGLYLVVEDIVPEMVTSTTNPFFVSLPMTTVSGDANSASPEGGHFWNYDVVVYPKNETGIPTLEKTVREAIDKLKELGAEILEISLPNTDYAISTYYLISPAEAATNLARYDGVSYGERAEDAADLVEMMTKTRTQYLGEEVKRRIMIGNYALSAGYYDAYYLKALKVRRLIKEDFDKAFEQVDVIVCPTAPTPAYKIGEKISNPLEMYLQDACTVPLNLAGLPGISVPCGYSSDNMPIGLQIIGKALDEETILRVAYTYEQSQSFHNDRAQLGGN